MKNLEHDENCALMKEHIADLLELVILETVQSVLNEILERRNRANSVICHKLKCPEREQDPF